MMGKCVEQQQVNTNAIYNYPFIKTRLPYLASLLCPKDAEVSLAKLEQSDSRFLIPSNPNSHSTNGSR